MPTTDLRPTEPAQELAAEKKWQRSTQDLAAALAVERERRQDLRAHLIGLRTAVEGYLVYRDGPAEAAVREALAGIRDTGVADE
jgi:hypothetical protein